MCVKRLENVLTLWPKVPLLGDRSPTGIKVLYGRPFITESFITAKKLKLSDHWGMGKIHYGTV